MRSLTHCPLTKRLIHIFKKDFFLQKMTDINVMMIFRDMLVMLTLKIHSLFQGDPESLFRLTLPERKCFSPCYCSSFSTLVDIQTFQYNTGGVCGIMPTYKWKKAPWFHSKLGGSLHAFRRQYLKCIKSKWLRIFFRFRFCRGKKNIRS